MSDAELIKSFDEDTELHRQLIDGLPIFFKKDEQSSNYKLFGAVTNKFLETEEDLENLNQATLVYETENIAELEELASLVGTKKLQDESFERFKTRVIADYKNITNEATISDLLLHFSDILDTSIDNIEHEDPLEPGLILFSVPKPAVENSPLTEEDISEIISNNAPAGYRVSTLIGSGTFEFITEEDYNNDVHDAELGYDGLDTDGNPKGNGGTYSTVI